MTREIKRAPDDIPRRGDNGLAICVWRAASPAITTSAGRRQYIRELARRPPTFSSLGSACSSRLRKRRARARIRDGAEFDVDENANEMLL